MLKAITNGILVEVEVIYRPDRSESHISNHFFEYMVHIKNKSNYRVKLLKRYWKILESPSALIIVEGKGVIGEQPILLPQQGHSYSSYSMIKDTIGLMKGTYTFLNMDTDEEFQVRVPAMNLITPPLLN